jgi:hypothetical protein
MWLSAFSDLLEGFFMISGKYVSKSLCILRERTQDKKLSIAVASQEELRQLDVNGH